MRAWSTKISAAASALQRGLRKLQSRAVSARAAVLRGLRPHDAGASVRKSDGTRSTACLGPARPGSVFRARGSNARHLHRCAAVVALAITMTFLFSGCSEAPERTPPKYPTLADRDVPDYLKGTIYQIADMEGTDPFPISGYGLVAHLHGTGGSRVATPIRAYMAKELARHSFGELTTNLPTPDQVLDDPNVTIVKVEGQIPPGARAGDGWSTWFDVRVSLLPESDATSLAHGVLYQSELKINGANPAEPGNGMVAVKGQAAGPIFLNPAYLLDTANGTAAAADGVRTGVVLAGARVLEDRPLILRLRSPDRRMARSIEHAVITRFQDVVDDQLLPDYQESAASAKKVANAQDEGRVDVYVPRIYTRNWQHFANLVKYLYLQGGAPGFGALKAKELAKAAVEPKAQLDKISYCLEGLGRPALPALAPLMIDRRPDVQFAATRAAAFIGDPAAVPTLLLIASTRDNPFRLSAVEVLGELPDSPRVNELCRTLLDSDDAQVRIAAYKLLAEHQDGTVYAHKINNNSREVFSLDMITSHGNPLVYATRQGQPRLAVFGGRVLLDRPMLFSAFDGKLTINCTGPGKPIEIFYRGSDVKKPVTVECGPNLDEVIANLAGDGKVGPNFLHFSYGEILAIVEGLIDQQLVSGPVDGRQMLAAFVPQEPSKLFAPVTGGRGMFRETGGRPQSDKPETMPSNGPNASPLRDGRVGADGTVPPVAAR
jgi:flagellar basal body P-ring protein FlgI